MVLTVNRLEIVYFNSIKVRLEQGNIDIPEGNIYNFISIKVRLELTFS